MGDSYAQIGSISSTDFNDTTCVILDLCTPKENWVFVNLRRDEDFGARG